MFYFDPDRLRLAGLEEVKASYGYVSTADASGYAFELLRKSGGELPEPPVLSATPTKLFDIFLSYSSLDWLLVLGLYRQLTQSYKKTVYVDQICDPQLNRAKVTRKTAEVLRRRMAQSKSLFCATTQNTSKSDWVPWELGFEDGFAGKVAILPITKSQSFQGQEYFELYPEVVPGTPPHLLIYDQGNSLGTWDGWVATPRII